ncbi:YwmB family TATA-box binding protein [Piscibacillus sp. B03]|uniref:YwmB family TATA-box binding protein n=1 Tax=Piscibacillus sp. B03 TaxID=3457430 RepID=UPI003FCD9319
MRWFSVVVLFLLTVSLFYQSSNSLLADVSTIEKLEEFFVEEGLDISSVSVTMHKVSNESEAKLFIKNQQQAQKNKNINESFNVVYLSENRVKVVYEFKGAVWSEKVKGLLQNRMLNPEFRHFFKNGQIYSCFQSRTDVKINSNFMIDKIINFYNIQKTNVMDEEKFKVVSGTTEQFEQYIPLDNEHINIQFAIREQENGTKTITIGTPILVIEY